MKTVALQRHRGGDARETRADDAILGSRVIVAPDPEVDPG